MTESNQQEKSPIEMEPIKYRKLFVASLATTTTNEDLDAYFREYGEIIERHIVKNPVTKFSRCFGFVTYNSSTAIDNVMANRPHTLDGSRLEVRRAAHRDNNEAAAARNSELLTNKLFIGGIKEGPSECHLNEYFSTYGTIEG